MDETTRREEHGIEQAFNRTGVLGHPTSSSTLKKEDPTRTSEKKEDDMTHEESDKMRTFAVYNRGGQETTTEADVVINEDGWWGKAYVLYIGRGFDPLIVVVEADCFGDAVDEFVDSDWGWHLTDDVDECEACSEGRIDDCSCSFGGNCGIRYDSDRLAFAARCSTVKAPAGWDPKQWALMQMLGAPPTGAPTLGHDIGLAAF